MQKLDVTSIIRDHLKTLKIDGQDGYSLIDIFVFFGIPAAITALAAYFDFHLNSSDYNFAVTVFTIFIGLLLNIQVLIFGSLDKNSNERRSALLRQTFANISFCILLFFIGFVCALALMYVPGLNRIKYAEMPLIFLTLCAVFVLLMIMKRVHVVMQNEFDD